MAARRGQLMDEAASHCSGGMMAVVTAEPEEVLKRVAELEVPDPLLLANDNAPNQIVLTGELSSLDAAAAMVARHRLGRCKRLFVAGSCHSRCMVSARKAFEEWAELLVFRPPHTPIILNATAKEASHPSTIKHLITWQLTSPVFWRESMNRLRELGVDTLLEIGPGRILSGLARVNGFREARICNVNNLRGVEQAAGLAPQRSDGRPSPTACYAVGGGK